VYILTIFHVSESLSCSLATGNRHKVTLHPRTVVVLDDSFLIHRYGLSCSKTDAILRPRLEYFHLVGSLLSPCVLSLIVVVLSCVSLLTYFLIICFL